MVQLMKCLPHIARDLGSIMTLGAVFEEFAPSP